MNNICNFINYLNCVVVLTKTIRRFEECSHSNTDEFISFPDDCSIYDFDAVITMNDRSHLPSALADIISVLYMSPSADRQYIYPKQDVMDILLAMENYADLHKKNISAYLTARAWLKRRIQVPQRQDPLQPKPGKVNTMLNILQNIANDDTIYHNCNSTDTALLEG